MNIDRSPLLVVREFYGLAVAALTAAFAAPRDSDKLAFAVLASVGVPALCGEIEYVGCLGTVFACGEADACCAFGNGRLVVINALIHAVVADVCHLDSRPLGKGCAV